MAKKAKKAVEAFAPMTAKVHGGEFTVTITGTDKYSRIIVSSPDKSFKVPFSRFSEYFETNDPAVIIDRMKYFEKFTFDEFQDYFESNEEQAALIATFYLCTRPTKPWYSEGIPIIVYMMCRTAACRNRHERLVSMFHDLVLETGMPVGQIEREGFNDCVLDALRVYEKAHDADTEQEKISVIAASGNEFAITIKRYNLECQIRFATEAKAWRRRKKLNDLLETLNSKCNDQRNSQ